MARKPTLPCPITDCPKLRDAQQIFCAVHWFKVKKRTREEIWDSHGEMLRARSLESIARYRAARAAAFAELGQKEK